MLCVPKDTEVGERGPAGPRPACLVDPLKFTLSSGACCRDIASEDVGQPGGTYITQIVTVGHGPFSLISVQVLQGQINFSQILRRALSSCPISLFSVKGLVTLWGGGCRPGMSAVTPGAVSFCICDVTPSCRCALCTCVWFRLLRAWLGLSHIQSTGSRG